MRAAGRVRSSSREFWAALLGGMGLAVQEEVTEEGFSPSEMLVDVVRMNPPISESPAWGPMVDRYKEDITARIEESRSVSQHLESPRDISATLSELPWFARELHSDLHCDWLLKQIDKWSDVRQIFYNIEKQREAVLSARGVLQLLSDVTTGLHAGTKCAVHSDTITAFIETLWTEVARTTPDLSLGTRSLPTKVSGYFTRRAGDRLAPAALHEWLQDYPVPVTRHDAVESRIKMYEERRFEAERQLAHWTRYYGPMVIRMIPHNRLQLPLLGCAPLQDVLEAPHFTMVGAENALGDDDTFPLPQGLVPDVLTTWQQQCRLAMMLDTPPFKASVYQALNHLNQQVKQVEKEARKRLQELDDLRSILERCRAVLMNSSFWASKRCDVRWYRACVVTWLARMTTPVIPWACKGAFDEPECLDYEYMRLVTAAKVCSTNWMAVVQDWLVDPSKACSIVFNQENPETIILVRRAVLEAAGLGDKCRIAGDVNATPSPVILSARTIQDLEIINKRLHDNVKIEGPLYGESRSPANQIKRGILKNHHIGDDHQRQSR